MSWFVSFGLISNVVFHVFRVFNLKNKMVGEDTLVGQLDIFRVKNTKATNVVKTTKPSKHNCIFVSHSVKVDVVTAYLAKKAVLLILALFSLSFGTGKRYRAHLLTAGCHSLGLYSGAFV